MPAWIDRLRRRPLSKPEPRTVQFNINSEIDRYFDDSSLSNDAPPRIVMVMGGPACGKTTLRKQRYATGYVLVDAADIFLNLSRGEFFSFPKAFEVPMQMIGRGVAERAVRERRHIVTELLGLESETKALFDALLTIGYKLDIQMLTCSVEEAQRRNIHRGDDSISSYHAEPYQRAWLSSAAALISGSR